MKKNKRLIDLDVAIAKIQDEGVLGEGYAAYERIEDVCDMLEDCPTVEAVEVVRCAYCDPGSQDYNPCWLCKKGGTAHDVEHCHRTNYGDYEPMQPHCHLCGRKL